MNHKANGWRLPTEAEWEIVSQPDDSVPLQERAWFETNANGLPHRLALQNANIFGVFDTQGNLHEWIWERFGEFESTEATDPINCMKYLSPLCIHVPSKWIVCQFRNWRPTLQQTQRISVSETSEHWLQDWFEPFDNKDPLYDSTTRG